LTSPPIESLSPGTSSSMKRPSPLLSDMVLVLQQTSSSWMMILLTLCSLLLDRCTSFCLQEHQPSPPAPLPVPLRLCLGRPCRLPPPAPLPVPQRLCLGRLCRLPKMLMIHRRPRSTSRLCDGRRGHRPRHTRPPGLPLPRHTLPRRCPACLERPLRSTSCRRGTLARVPTSTLGSLLHAALHATTSSSRGCCSTDRTSTQGCRRCYSSCEPARHEHSVEERLSDACCLSCRSSLCGAEDLS
jgi:hypothetical protein